MSELIDMLEQLLRLYRRSAPKKIRVVLPVVFMKGKRMPNRELENDKEYVFPIIVDDEAGDPVPAPAGDTFQGTSSDPNAVAVSIDTETLPNGQPGVRCKPMQRSAPAISITVADTAGLQSYVFIVDVVEDLGPKMIDVDTMHPVTIDQPVPPETQMPVTGV